MHLYQTKLSTRKWRRYLKIRSNPVVTLDFCLAFIGYHAHPNHYMLCFSSQFAICMHYIFDWGSRGREFKSRHSDQLKSFEVVVYQRFQGFFSFLFQCTQNEIRSNPVVTVDFCLSKHCLIFKAYNVIIQLKSLRLYILFLVALGQTEGCFYTILPVSAKCCFTVRFIALTIKKRSLTFWMKIEKSRARDFSPARSFFISCREA